MRIVSLITIALLLLLLSSQQFGTNVAATNQPISSNAFVDHGIAAMNNQDIVSLGMLNSMTGGSQSVMSYEQVIVSQLIPSNVRIVLLDIGWQNYSVGEVPFEQWVANWLSASASEGIQNVFFVSQLTLDGVGSKWIDSLVKSDPYTQTSYANGTLADYISYDNPDVATALESDLSILYSYYGSYSSWVGIGTGTVNDAYNLTNFQLPLMVFAN